jgi:hypothetical protein
MQNPHHLDQLRFASVNDQIIPHSPETERLIREVTAKVADIWFSSRSANVTKDLVPHSVCQFYIPNLSSVVIPNFEDVRLGGRR